MLCRSISQLPEGPGAWNFEPKFDGFRALAGVDAAGRAQLRSRKSTDLTPAFANVAAAVADQFPRGSLVDGELVIWNGERLDFAQLQRRMASPDRALARTLPASYVIFDVLQYDGRDLAGQPQRVRRRQLEAVLHTLTPPLQIVPSTRDRDIAAQWFADYAHADVGIEGLL